MYLYSREKKECRKTDEEGFILVILKLLFDLKMCYTRETKEMHVLCALDLKEISGLSAQTLLERTYILDRWVLCL